MPRPKRTASLLLMAIILTGMTPASQAESPPAVDLIECADRQLNFKILCNPRWPREREPLSLSLMISEPDERPVRLTVEQSPEPGLSLADLTPPALQRVYQYQDHFTFARTAIGGLPAVRVEGQPQGQDETYLLDYFLLNEATLYRVSYAAQTRAQFRRYLPLFSEMMRSFAVMDFH